MARTYKALADAGDKQAQVLDHIQTETAASQIAALTAYKQQKVNEAAAIQAAIDAIAASLV